MTDDSGSDRAARLLATGAADPEALADDLAQEYSSHYLIQALLSYLLPVVGDAANNALAARAARFIEARIQRYCRALESECAAIRKDHVRRDFFRSDDFAQIFLEIGTRVARTRCEEKIDRFAVLTVRATTLDLAADRIEAAYRLLDELTNTEFLAAHTLLEIEDETLRLLQEAFDRDGAPIDYSGICWTQVAARRKDLDHQVLRSALATAAARGALEQEAGARTNYVGGSYHALLPLRDAVELTLRPLPG